MFEKVLVAMDLSPATEALVSALPGMKEALNLRARLNALANRLRAEGFEVTVDVPSGVPVEEITKMAERRDPDVILVGSRSWTRIQEAFVGAWHGMWFDRPSVRLSCSGSKRIARIRRLRSNAGVWDCPGGSFTQRTFPRRLPGRCPGSVALPSRLLDEDEGDKRDGVILGSQSRQVLRRASARMLLIPAA